MNELTTAYCPICGQSILVEIRIISGRRRAQMADHQHGSDYCPGSGTEPTQSDA